MAINEETVQVSSYAGVVPTFNAADAVNHHQFVNNGRTIIHVKNADAAPTTVTLKASGTFDGDAVFEDQDVTVAAGAEKEIGPFKQQVFNKSGANAGKIEIQFSNDTTITFSIFSVG